MFTRHEALRPATNLSQRFATLEAARAAKEKDTHLPHWAGVAWTAVTLLIMAYSWRFAVWPILLYFGMWFGLVLWKGPRLLMPTRDMLVAMTMPLLALVSTVWSHYPSKSLYLGTCFVLMMGCILLMARTVRFRAFAEGLMLGAALTLTLTLINGTYMVDAMDGRYSLRGLFPTKNQVGFCAELGILACVVMLFGKGHFARKLALVVLPLIICGWCLFQSHSGTAILSLAAALAMVGTVTLVMRLRGQLRLIAMASVFFLTVGIIGSAIAFDLRGVVLKGLGKDETLTGRTYLWEQGMKIGWQEPVLGHGYGGFWVPGEPEAERLWAEFHIPQLGFHFHNTYVETFVELGFVGLGLIILLILGNLIGALRLAYRQGMTAELALLLALSCLFLVRSFAEVDFFMGPFGMGTSMFYFILPRLAQMRREEKDFSI